MGGNYHPFISLYNFYLEKITIYSKRKEKNET